MKYLLSLSFLFITVFAEAVDEKPTNDLEKNNNKKEEVAAFIETRNESELYNLIIERDFGSALQRVLEHPSESKILINVLGGPKGIDVVNFGLPLHFAFSVDIPENLPQAKRHVVMPEDQVLLILALLKENPLATKQKNKFGHFPLHLALLSPIIPPENVILKMIKFNPNSLRVVSSQGQTALHMAVSYPMTSMNNIEIILKEYPEAVEVRDEDDSLPIHIAAWGGNYPESKAIIEVLLEENPSHLSIADGDNETILSLMAKYGRTSEDSIRFILEQDKIAIYKYRDKLDGNTLLHHAVISSFQQNSTVYKPILEFHKDLLKKVNIFGRLPIHVALLRCCISTTLLMTLLEGYPQGASYQDGAGFLPIHYACSVGVKQTNLVAKLIDHLPSSVRAEGSNSKSEKGRLPLHLALAHGATQGDLYSTMNEVIQILIERYPEAVNLRDPKGDILPIVQAFLTRRSPEVIIKMMELTPESLSSEVVINESGKEKSTTLLHLFSAQGHGYMEPKDIIEIINKFALQDPQLFRKPDSDGRLPLHMVWMQFESIAGSRQAMVDLLLSHNPGAVHVADKEGFLPLMYLLRAKDLNSFDKIFPLNPFAASMKSMESLYPLHILCGFGAAGVFTDGIDKMITTLLDRYPAAAAEPDKHGNYPLHFLCKTAGSNHVETRTVQKLIDAYPDVLALSDENDMSPLQLAVLSAVYSHMENEHYYWASLIDLLIDKYPQAVKEVQAGSLPISIAIDKLETLSIHRRNDNDFMLKVIQRLYVINPEGIKSTISKNRNGLHALLALLGDMGGMAPQGWTDFVMEVIRDFPELASQQDIHQRTPLHVFCLYLGDTAIGMRENQDIRTRSNSPQLEEAFIASIKVYTDALDQLDQYRSTPVNIVSHKRLRYAKGGKRFYNSELINMMKRHLRKGKQFWEWRSAVDAAGNCTELRMILEEANMWLKKEMDSLEIDVNQITYENNVCRNETVQCCIDEQEMLGYFEMALQLYGGKMEEMGKDESEISGDYYPGGFSY
jgi:ankyrin repeat protein